MKFFTKAILCASLIFSGVGFAGDYVAYSVDEKGNKRPMPENVDNLNAEDTINIVWGNYKGNKVRVAVLKVENESKKSSYSVIGHNGIINVENIEKGVAVDGIEAILTDSMLHTGRFRMVERQEVDETIKEQDFGASGRVSKPSAAKIGKILGAEYLIKAVITEYDPNFKGSTLDIGGIIGLLAGGSKKASKVSSAGFKRKTNNGLVAMNFRIIDATTSEVLYSKQVKSICSASGYSIGGGLAGNRGALGGLYSSYAKTPIGQALIGAINKGIFEIVKQVGTARVQGEVIKVAGNKVYVNLGSGTVKKGDSMTLVALGEDLIDPKTGLSLGAEEEEIGRIRVTKVRDKFSIAKAIDADLSEAGNGDRVLLDGKVDSLKFGKPWKSSSSSDMDGGQEAPDVMGDDSDMI
mgnify:CR=1 FL=1